MSIEELEAKCVDANHWQKLPIVVKELAIICSIDGVPTAVGRDKVFGWYILQGHSVFGKYIAWSERNFDKRPM